MRETYRAADEFLGWALVQGTTLLEKSTRFFFADLLANYSRAVTDFQTFEDGRVQVNSDRFNSCDRGKSLIFS